MGTYFKQRNCFQFRLYIVVSYVKNLYLDYKFICTYIHSIVYSRYNISPYKTKEKSFIRYSNYMFCDHVYKTF